ncbi:hypothetical protein ACFV24_12405 [Nocardia fluminea]
MSIASFAGPGTLHSTISDARVALRDFDTESGHPIQAVGADN